MPNWHLAQVNVARLLAPLDSPRLAAFVAALEPVNAAADGSPGFVWRLQTESGDATEIHAFDDERIIVNLTVWEDVESLQAFVFSTPHRDVLRRRREWFEQMAEAYATMWWIPVGSLPTIAEAKDRLALLDARGSTLDAFTFREPFPAPNPDEAPASHGRLTPA